MKPITSRKANQVNPDKEKFRNELMDAYLTFVQDAGYDGYPVEKVDGWPKRDQFFLNVATLLPSYSSDPDIQNVIDLADNYIDKFWLAEDKVRRDVLIPSLFNGYNPKDVAFIDLPDTYDNDNFVSLPRPEFRVDKMNPFEFLGFEQEIPARQLQTRELPQQMDRIKTEPIMRADASVRGGQYQVGERVWDPEKKKWQNRMWDREDKKASRELQGELKENWRRGLRNIETPPGGFKYGGKIKVKKKNC